LALCLQAAGLMAEPFVPTSDAVVLETLPLVGDPAYAHARALAAELDKAPADEKLAVATARAWLALGRLEGDPRFVGRAEAALTAWRAIAAPPPAIRLARGAILQARHDHAGAAEELAAVLYADPTNVQAWLERATVEENLGDPAAARRACVQVARLRPGLLAEACLASAESLGGKAAAASATLTRAVAVLNEPDLDVRRWAVTVLGDIAARRGQGAEAERHYREAQAAGGDDIYLRLALADLLLDQGRAGEVIAAIGEDSPAEGLLLRRAEALAATGSAEAEPLTDRLAQRFAAMRQRGDVSHLRDEARFLLLIDDPAAALDRAARNWPRQRTPADARLLMAAALAARQPEAARPALEWLAATGIEDVTLGRLRTQLEAAS
jgi:Tfp pilus assembly protein PilF